MVITLHGTSILLLPFRMRSALVDWAIRHATRVIAVAPNLEARARQARVSPDRLAVIPNGVDPFRFSPVDRSTARNRVGMPSSGLLIVSVGHVSPRKGFQRVIRILPRLAEHHPDVTFAIVGGAGAETYNQPVLQRLAHEVGMANRVRFAGACSPDDVANWLLQRTYSCWRAILRLVRMSFGRRWRAGARSWRRVSGISNTWYRRSRASYSMILKMRSNCWRHCAALPSALGTPNVSAPMPWLTHGTK